MPLPLTYPIGHDFPAPLPALAPATPHPEASPDDLDSAGLGQTAPALLGTLALALFVLTMLGGLAWVFHPATNPFVAMANKPAELLASVNAQPRVEGRFDREAATRSLDMAVPAAAASCGVVAKAGQTLPLEVTFLPEGRVASAKVVTGVLSGTREGDCLASALEKTPAAPFGGPGVTLTQSIPLQTSVTP